MFNRNYAFLYICVSTGCLLGFISGLPLTWTSPVMPILEGSSEANPLPGPLSKAESSWIISVISLGAAIGPILTAFTTKFSGLKYSLIGIGTMFLISFAILTLINTVVAYLIARMLAGLAMGSVYSVLPPYIADVSPDAIRGALGSVFNIFIVAGMMLPYCIGPYISILALNIICTAFSLIFVIAFIFMPESPVYLITKERNSEAKKILQKLRGSMDVQDEFELMLKTEELNKVGNLSDIFKIRSNFKALMLSSWLAILQQMSGVNIVTVNTQSIFEESGSSIPADISAMLIGGVQLVASFITPFFVDSYGRRFLFLVSFIGMLVSEVPLGAYFYMKDDGSNVDDIYWLPVVCLMVFMMTFNVGIGPVLWTFTAEVFPPNMMSYGSSITASVCWITSFLLTYFYVDITDSIGTGGAFWIFSIFNVVAIVFIIVFIPETKGKTTIEIQDKLK